MPQPVSAIELVKIFKNRLKDIGRLYKLNSKLRVLEKLPDVLDVLEAVPNQIHLSPRIWIRDFGSRYPKAGYELENIDGKKGYNFSASC